jgi:hypothetical protein
MVTREETYHALCKLWQWCPGILGGPVQNVEKILNNSMYSYNIMTTKYCIRYIIFIQKALLF